MARIYKMADRIPIKIDDMVIHISPLNYENKAICQGLILNGRHMDAAVHALKNAIKDIDGLETADGSKYELEIENNQLTNDCLDELLNVQGSDKMQLVAISLLQGIPDSFTDPVSGKEIDGISFVKEPSGKK